MNILNFYLLDVNGALVQKLRPTTSLDTYIGLTKDFHDDGLYSTLTFGPIGSERRDITFSYVDIGIEIISPVIALALFELKHLYSDILAGKRYAVWDAILKDFEPATPTTPGASTGYSFFIKHWNELTPKTSESLIRQQNIDLFNKYREIALSRYVLVYPAGLRDLEITPGVEEQEVEVNKYYRKLIASSKLVPGVRKEHLDALDSIRWNLQKTFIDIFNYFFDYEEGKRGFTRGKWASRNIVHGTRNVLSCMDTSSAVLDRPDALRPTDTVVGMYQGVKSMLPVAQHAIRTRYLQPVVSGDGILNLVNKKTLRNEIVMVKPDEYDRVATDEGIERLIDSWKTIELRHAPVEIAGHYVALIYVDKATFKVFYDITELPPGFDKNLVRPITLTELIYLSGYDKWNNYYSLLTRYPVQGQGSTYSTTVRLTTTRTTSMKYELMEDWLTRKEPPAVDFPTYEEEEFFLSMAPHTSHLAVWLLNAD